MCYSYLLDICWKFLAYRNRGRTGARLVIGLPEKTAFAIKKTAQSLRLSRFLMWGKFYC